MTGVCRREIMLRHILREKVFDNGLFYNFNFVVRIVVSVIVTSWESRTGLEYVPGNCSWVNLIIYI